KLADDTRTEIAETNKRIDDGSYRASFDPTKTYVVPKSQDPAPYLNFAPLQNAADVLQRSAQAWSKQSKATSGGVALGVSRQVELDQVLMKAERALTREEGLPRRSWYIHHVYAPGFYTGYGVKTLPGVREAIEQKNWKEADAEIEVTAGVLRAFAAEVDR